MKEIKNVSIIGMGALGVMYGSHLAHHMGFDHVTYIMDEKRYEKYKGSTVTCNGEELSFTCVPASQAVPADSGHCCSQIHRTHRSTGHHEKLYRSEYRDPVRYERHFQ